MVSRLVAATPMCVPPQPANSAGGHLKAHVGFGGGAGRPAPSRRNHQNRRYGAQRRGLIRSVVRYELLLVRSRSFLASQTPSAPAGLEVAEKPCQARAVILSVRTAEPSKNWVRAGGTGNFIHRDQVEQFRGSSKENKYPSVPFRVSGRRCCYQFDVICPIDVTKLWLRINIYVEHLDPGLSEKIRQLDDLRVAEDDLLLVHHSMGHDAFSRLAALRCRKFLVYHNITPPELLEDPGTQAYAIKGYSQTFPASRYRRSGDRRVVIQCTTAEQQGLWRRNRYPAS